MYYFFIGNYNRIHEYLFKQKLRKKLVHIYVNVVKATAKV